MKLNWSSPITWMIAGVVIVIIGVGIAGLSGGGNDGAGNPVAGVGAIFFLIGAFTWAIRRGMTRGSGR